MYNVYICNMFMQNAKSYGITYLEEDIRICLRLHASITAIHFLPLILLIYDLNHHFWEKISLSLDLQSSEMLRHLGNGEDASVALFYSINQIKVS